MVSPAFPLLSARLPPLAWLPLALLALLSGCQGDAPPPPPAGEFTHPRELAEGEDGLVRRTGEDQPYTGPAIIRDDDWNLRSFAYYQDGKLHGPEMRFNPDGKIRRVHDYEQGEKGRHREWHEGGLPKVDNIPLVPDPDNRVYHRTWHEDGSVRWRGYFVDGLKWDGAVIDRNPEGEVIWEAVFDRGRFVSGRYPETAQDQLIESGRVKPEDALYPARLQPGEVDAPAPAPADPPGEAPR